ncbi:hypothetical protein Tsubulata_018644 [Turnera subulata]|uniref:SAP domain-containing protein n=1 Tax=Turnera subulata TaxID=218843 RepID=A0A9Q0GE97_9ROSI|nr:hypothetical protein Tsubulata_018644 [Turnera subulata]
MSSQYPILDNRPIDQWKVTELKEELKRRRLPLKGLKDDLIRRLDEALRVERENEIAALEAKDVDNGLNLNPQPVDEVQDTGAVQAITETATLAVDDTADKHEVDNARVPIDVNNSIGDMEQGHHREFTLDGTDSATVEGEVNVHAVATLEGSVTVIQDAVSVSPLSGQDTQVSGVQGVEGVSIIQMKHEDSKMQVGSEDLKIQIDYEGSKTQLGGDDSRVQLDNEDSNTQATLHDEDSKIQLNGENVKSQLDNEDSKTPLDNEDSKIGQGNEGLKPLQENTGLKPLHEDVLHDSSAPANQVSEVSPNLGFEINSDSISTDSVSNNEKIELKDNVITDTVKLELDDLKAEMVEPSPSNVVAVGGTSHPMDVEEPQEKASVEEEDESNSTIADLSKKNDIVDGGYSEKLNLDRSSGDESMEEDVMDIKQIDSKDNSSEIGDKSDKSEVPVVKEENLIDVVRSDFPVDQKEVRVENKIHGSAALPAEKRKLNDQEALENTEPVKRQRRWGSESLKISEQQGSVLTSSTTPKNSFQPTPLRRSFTRSDSSVSEEAPKERVVPPPQKPPTNSLRIDRFLRPFTLKAVQELLGKTGSVTSFWMDHIKTHCYVTYSSVEEAIETRNAVYNLQWPPNGGRLLVADFVDPQDVKMRVEAPPQSPAAPVTPSATAPAPPTVHPQPSPRQQPARQQLPPPPSLPPPPPLSNPPLVKERLAQPPPPPQPERHDPPIVTLDDLFRKTKATPRIYYLPLSEEQVAAKLAEQRKRRQ